MKQAHLLLLVGLAALVLIGSRCSPSRVTPPEPLPQSEAPSAEADEGVDQLGVKFVSYTNRAQGYTILRPANWYWRHYIANEIKNMNSEVVDYFITDPNPLPGLGSEYLGKIVIEVSKRPLSDYQDSVAGLEMSEQIVGGMSAKKYTGERISQSSEKTAVVEYQFAKGDSTWRLILIRSDEIDEKIFDQVVSSLRFD